MKRVLFWIVVGISLMAMPAFADGPFTMSYQGVLTKDDGTIAGDGNYNISFSIYSVSTGGTALWTENHNGSGGPPPVPVVRGGFSVILGDVASGGTALSTLPFDTQYYLGISVQGGAEVMPRTQLTASPYDLGGRWAASGGDVYRASGQVGIGGTPSGAGVLLDLISPADPKLRWHYGTGGGAGFWDTRANASGGFEFDYGGNPSSVLIDANGNVGIGTGANHPHAPLELKDAGAGEEVMRFGYSAADYHFIAAAHNGASPAGNQLQFNLEHGGNDVRPVETLMGTGDVVLNQSAGAGTSGLILRDSSGHCWRLYVDTSGGLHTESAAGSSPYCP